MSKGMPQWDMSILSKWQTIQDLRFPRAGLRLQFDTKRVSVSRALHLNQLGHFFESGWKTRFSLHVYKLCQLFCTGRAVREAAPCSEKAQLSAYLQGARFGVELHLSLK